MAELPIGTVVNLATTWDTRWSDVNLAIVVSSTKFHTFAVSIDKFTRGEVRHLTEGYWFHTGKQVEPQDVLWALAIYEQHLMRHEKSRK